MPVQFTHCLGRTFTRLVLHPEAVDWRHAHLSWVSKEPHEIGALQLLHGFLSQHCEVMLGHLDFGPFGRHHW